MVILKVDFNGELRLLGDLPNSLKELYSQLRQKFGESFPSIPFVKYRDKDEFWLKINNDEELKNMISQQIKSKVKMIKIKVEEEVNNNFLLQSKTSNPYGIQLPSPSTTDTVQNTFNFGGFKKQNTLDGYNTFSSDERINDELKGILPKEKEIDEFRGVMHNKEKEIEQGGQGALKIKKKGIEIKNEVITKECFFSAINGFSEIQCYKCQGKGFKKNKNKKCKKCNGTTNVIQSKKMLVIDYFLQEKLPFLHKEFSKIEKKTNFPISNLETSLAINEKNCAECRIPLGKAVKYKCTQCINNYLCSRCEANHSHPLIKYKNKTNFNESKIKPENFGSKSVQLPVFSFEEKEKKLGGGGSLIGPSKKEEKINLSNSVDRASDSSNLAKQNNLNTSISLSSTYKVKILREPESPKEVLLGEEFTISYEMINNGDSIWPQNLNFECLSGFFNNFVGIPSLKPGEKYEVNIALQAPKKEETIYSNWRLYYLVQNSKKYFGPRLQLVVQSIKNKKKK